jgi:mRNA interferase RelE/StbE
MQIKYSKQAVKAINKINNPFKKNIKEAIERLPDGDVKKLKGYSNAYRLRVGDYRILFDMNGEIEITAILPRGDAYKNK